MRQRLFNQIGSFEVGTRIVLPIRPQPASQLRQPSPAPSPVKLRPQCWFSVSFASTTARSLGEPPWVKESDGKPRFKGHAVVKYETSQNVVATSQGPGPCRLGALSDHCAALIHA
jgi:hypothetical protein